MQKQVVIVKSSLGNTLHKIGHNVLQLPEGGDFEALHCQPSTNYESSTALDLTIEPPILGRCC
jgi:hypothetical protein